MADDMDVKQKFEEFLEWDRNRNSTLTIAFQELDVLMNAPMSVRADGVMGVNAFRVLGRALIALKEEVCK